MCSFSKEYVFFFLDKYECGGNVTKENKMPMRGQKETSLRDHEYVEKCRNEMNGKSREESTRRGGYDGRQSISR